MPRIPDAEVTRLKQSVPLTRLCEARGVILKGQGHNLIGLCPFHDDREPSLVVDPEKNLWNCLGACRCGGSNLDFVMKDHGVGFRVAVEILAGMVGGAAYPARPAGYESGALKNTSARRLSNPISADADGDALLGQLADFYHRVLTENSLATAEPALAYLRSRKLADPEAIRHFRIGYADRSLGLRIPDKARREGAQIRIRMGKLGLLRDSGHELMSGAVVVPIMDDAGAVVGMYGRMTSTALRVGTAYHRYLPGPHRAAWNAAGAAAAAADADGAVILCEAILDGLTFWCHGFRHVTAAYGVNGFTEHHRRLLSSDAVKSVYIAYDNDDAGNAAAAALADELIGQNRSVYRVRFPERVKDANGLAVASEEPAAALRAALADAQWLGGPPRVIMPALPARDEQPAAKIEKTVATVVPEPVPVPPAAAAILPLVAQPSEPRPSLLTADGEDLCAAFGPRRYRLRSLLKNVDASVLKVGLRLTVTGRDGETSHQDTVDLCQAKQRSGFMAAASEATSTDPAAIRADLGLLLDACESAWEAHRRAASSPGPKRPAMDAAAEAAARAFLRTPDLLARIAADYEACGLVGDAAPKLVSYLCAISRKLDQPLAVLTMAPSAAGKTSLQDGTLAFVPEEDRLCLSAMTGQALHYIEDDLSHRVLAIAEEEGASRAAYSLKLLQSEGKISLAVPIKDAESGQIVTKIKEVRGPVALFLTTTAPQIDEELANRCIVLTVDESPEQTARVHAAQRERETLDGMLRRRRAEAIRAVHQDAQRLLEPVEIINPYAQFLTFRIDRPRTRRDHMKYLGLIRAIAFLHQHQRPRHTVAVAGREVTYIEVSLADIAAANQLAAAVLGRSLDELAPQTRTLLLRLDALVRERAAEHARPREAIRFTRREVREFCKWSYNQVRDHLSRLVDLELAVPTRSGGTGQTATFMLAYDGQGQDGEAFVMGLVDVASISRQAADSTGTTSTLSPQQANLVPHLSPACPGVVPHLWGDEIKEISVEISDELAEAAEFRKKAYRGGVSIPPSNHTANGHPAAAAAGLPVVLVDAP